MKWADDGFEAAGGGRLVPPEYDAFNLYTIRPNLLPAAAPDEPYGLDGEWGYCGKCQFVVPVLGSGGLAAHTRGAGIVLARNCPGTYRRPWTRTPAASRKNRFRVTPTKGPCWHCGLTVTIDVSGFPHWHLRPEDQVPPDRTWARDCPGALKMPPAAGEWRPTRAA